jgi:hypothetical protein
VANLTTALVSNARLIAYNSTAAINFDSPEEAEAGLGALRIHENIVGACISTKPGEIFASYLRDGAPVDLFDNLRLG